jgi:hypothetical protein
MHAAAWMQHGRGVAVAPGLSAKALEYIAIFGVWVACPASAVDFCSKKATLLLHRNMSI